ncbi:succinate dehydrogenase cytochrome b subunit [Lutibacter sp.]|uniref:succinate dehydrogenase cytochrome b subunit n=1 Tax=Lutibacter sp. TaxID=1925666 RepID=UPI0025C445D3|nr:succinate dehydrogenase cytochrome b subunit [Lutibacter sp.]MCF6182752.1 succinate dehydrogenase cytochrome b subunit [Lutibacter sp.]
MNKFLTSSIGRKIVMSLTGFFLIIFLIVHLSINLSLFWGPNAFNEASEFMATNGVIQVMQYILAAGFILHIIQGISLELKNRSARSIKYVVNKPSENSTFASRNMIYTGILVLLFLILHLWDFFVQLKFVGIGNLTDYELVTNRFSSPLFTAIYVIAFVLLGIHLSHGFQSAFQSTGANYNKYKKCLKYTGIAFSILIAVGFSAIALYFSFIN